MDIRSWDSISSKMTMENTSNREASTITTEISFSELTSPFNGDFQQAKALFEVVNARQKQEILHSEIDLLKKKNKELQEKLSELEENFKAEIEDRERIIDHLQLENQENGERAAGLQAQLDKHTKVSKETYEKLDTSLTCQIVDLKEKLLLKDVQLKQAKTFIEERAQWKAEIDKLKEEKEKMEEEFQIKASELEANFNRAEKKILDEAKQRVKEEAQATKEQLEKEMDEESKRMRHCSQRYKSELGYQGVQIQTILGENDQLKSENEKLKMTLKDSYEVKDLMSKKVTYLERSLKSLQDRCTKLKQMVGAEEESEPCGNTNGEPFPSHMAQLARSLKSAMAQEIQNGESGCFDRSVSKRTTSPTPPLKHRVGRPVSHRRKIRPASAIGSVPRQTNFILPRSAPPRARTTPNSRRPTMTFTEDSVNTFGTITTMLSPRPPGTLESSQVARFEEFSQVTMPMDVGDSLELSHNSKEPSRTPSCALRDRIEELSLHLEARKKADNLHWARTQLAAGSRQQSARSSSSASEKRIFKGRAPTSKSRPATASKAFH